MKKVILFLFFFFLLSGLFSPSVSAQTFPHACPSSGWSPCEAYDSSKNYSGFIACNANGNDFVCCPSSLNMVADGVSCICRSGYIRATTWNGGCVRDTSGETPREDNVTGGGNFGSGGNNGGWQRGGSSAVPSGDDFSVTKETLDAFNPLVQEGNQSGQGGTGPLNTPGAVITRFLTSFAFPIAGLILFVMLVWGGFEILSGAASKKSMDAGKQRIQSALLGFLLLFISYWLVQLIEYVFGVSIL